MRVPVPLFPPNSPAHATLLDDEVASFPQPLPTNLSSPPHIRSASPERLFLSRLSSHLAVDEAIASLYPRSFESPLTASTQRSPQLFGNGIADFWLGSISFHL